MYQYYGCGWCEDAAVVMIRGGGVGCGHSPRQTCTLNPTAGPMIRFDPSPFLLVKDRLPSDASWKMPAWPVEGIEIPEPGKE